MVSVAPMYIPEYIPIQYFYDDPQYSRSTLDTLVGLRDFIKAENKVFLYTYFHKLKTQVTKFKYVVQFFGPPSLAL